PMELPALTSPPWPAPLNIPDPLPARKSVLCPTGKTVFAPTNGEVAEVAKAAPKQPEEEQEPVAAPTFRRSKPQTTPSARHKQVAQDNASIDDEGTASKRSEAPVALGVSGLGVASLVLGILGATVAMIPCIGFYPGIGLGVIGLILGAVGWSTAGTTTGKGIPIAGTILSICSIGIAVVWVYVIAAAFQHGMDKVRS